MAQPDDPNTNPDNATPRHRSVRNDNVKNETWDQDYRPMLETMAEEREAARKQRELNAQANILDKRERRQFWRNAGLAAFIAVMFNNPAMWIGAFWQWLKQHVSIH